MEWQVFRDTENTEKIMEMSTKQKTQKIVENSMLATQKTKISKKIIVLKIFQSEIHHYKSLTC